MFSFIIAMIGWMIPLFEFILNTQLYLGVVLFLFLIPILSFALIPFVQVIMVLPRIIGIGTPDANLTITTALSLSLNITMIAFLIGNLLYPNQEFSQSFQLLVTNTLLDVITLIVTFNILKWSIKQNVSIRIPIAIIADIFLAALFACISLYLGLFGSKNQMTFQETINILYAKSQDGSNWELGPYFWAMHTTFIPSLFYLMFICLTIIGKYITLPIIRFVKGVSGAKKPYYATATTFGFISGMLLAIAKSIERYYT